MPIHTVDQQAAISLRRLLPRLEARFADADLALWTAFAARLTDHFASLFPPLLHLYGGEYDFFYHLERLLDMAARSWLARSPELRALDAAREAAPRWFQAQTMIGGVCYVDLFAGDLSGVWAKIPYFAELNLTYLHLMPLFAAPAGNSDGGYAVSSYREVDAALGTMAELREQTASGDLSLEGLFLKLTGGLREHHLDAVLEA